MSLSFSTRFGSSVSSSGCGLFNRSGLFSFCRSGFLGRYSGICGEVSFFLACELFFDSGCFTSPLSQVVQLGASDVTAALDCDFFNAGRIDQEDTLDADALEYAANGNCFADSGTTAFDDYAFVALDALFGTFNDFDEDLDGVANIHLRGVALDERRFNFLDNLIHDKKTLFLPADKAAEGTRYTILRVDMKYYQLNPRRIPDVHVC